MSKIPQEDIETLMLCAVRYCHGRQSYMPTAVMSIVISGIKDVSDKTLNNLIKDCEYQKEYNLYGDERIDKPNWLSYHKLLLEEKARRSGLT